MDGRPALRKETHVKKEVKPKKLTLSRETLCALTKEEIKAVVGGAMRPTTNSVDVCCA